MTAVFQCFARGSRAKVDSSKASPLRRETGLGTPSASEDTERSGGPQRALDVSGYSKPTMREAGPTGPAWMLSESPRTALSGRPKYGAREGDTHRAARPVRGNIAGCLIGSAYVDIDGSILSHP